MPGKKPPTNATTAAPFPSDQNQPRGSARSRRAAAAIAASNKAIAASRKILLNHATARMMSSEDLKARLSLLCDAVILGGIDSRTASIAYNQCYVIYKTARLEYDRGSKFLV